MATTENLYIRNGVYHARKQVPRDLQHLYSKTDWRVSLRTKDRAEGIRRFHAQMTRWDEEFRATREEIQRSQQAERRKREFTASPTYRRAAEAVEKQASAVHIPVSGDLSEDLKSAIFYNQEALDEVNIAIASGGIDLVRYLDEDGEPFFVCPAWLVPEVEAFVAQRLQERKAALLATKATLEMRAEDASPPTNTLASLLPAWKLERDPRPRTEREMDYAIRVFEKVNGALPIGSINSDHIHEFKKHLLGFPKASQTKKKIWTLVRALLNIAKGNRQLPRNPMEDFSFTPSGESKRRENFTLSDIEAFFATHTDRDRDWWAFRIGLYSGARQGEILQLQRSDIRKVDGVWCFDFNEEGDGKSLKTRNSIRQVPIHKQLIEDGLLKCLPESGPLFPGNQGPASQRLIRRIKKAGIVGNKPFHSTRHTFKSAARQAKIGEDVHDRLTGHRAQHVGREYGTHSLPGLKEAIDLVCFGIEGTGAIDG